jgi:hypothetical protein
MHPTAVFRLDAPAAASRGETPAMLAAAKGHILALEWQESRGATYGVRIRTERMPWTGRGGVTNWKQSAGCSNASRADDEQHSARGAMLHIPMERWAKPCDFAILLGVRFFYL